MPVQETAPAGDQTAHLEGGKVIQRILHWHKSALEMFLARPVLLLLTCFVLIVGTYFAYQGLGSDLLPAMDEGGFILDCTMPAGSSIKESNRVIGHVEQILKETPEVESTSRRTGMQLGLAAVTESNFGDISVKLKSNRKRGIEDIIADVRAKVKEAEPELDTEYTQVLQDMIGDLSNAPEPIQIKIFCE